MAHKWVLRNLRFLILAGVLFAVAGCGSVAHHAEFEPQYSEKAATSKIEVGPVTNETGATLEVDVSGMFTQALTEQLQSQQMLWESATPGDHLIISTKVVEYDEGNAFKRWLLPGWGSTVLTLHCELKDSVSGKMVGTADARRTVSFGGAYTIGAWKTIFASVAKDVVSDLRAQLARG